MAKNSARDFSNWLQNEKKASRSRAAEEAKNQKPVAKKSVSASVAVSGPCTKCGQVNMATVATSGVAGSTAIASATATCGAAGCGGVAHLTGHAVLR